MHREQTAVIPQYMVHQIRNRFTICKLNVKPVSLSIRNWIQLIEYRLSIRLRWDWDAVEMFETELLPQYSSRDSLRS